MREYVLDGRKMLSREAAHEELKRVLELPSYYGRNLDALWDCVSTMKGRVVLTYADCMEEALGSYGELLEKVFTDAETLEFSKA